tara:strand:- start:490 stop:1425 length:936 start_codon:yes stop_codon:yes gene_type:complete
MKENRDFKGVWIPKEVWLNKDLSIIEKCLLVEIDSLDNGEKGCFASNEYLATFFNLSESRMANIISDLKKRGFINQIYFDGRLRGLRIVKSEVWFTENNKADSVKTVKQNTRKREHNNTMNKTTNNTDYIIENPSEFSHFEKIEINENEINKSQKVNPFTLITQLEKEKSFAPKREKAAEPKADRQPSPTYAAFSVFCQTFENLSGAAYPTDQNGHYIMMPKDAGQMVYLMRYIDKIDRQGDSLEALKVFIQAAWNLNDKWLKANFTIANLYSQASKIFTAYQTTSPAAKDKAYNDRIQELLAERMAKFQD